MRIFSRRNVSWITPRYVWASLRLELSNTYFVFHVLEQPSNWRSLGEISGHFMRTEDIPRAARWITCVGLYFSYSIRVCSGSLHQIQPTWMKRDLILGKDGTQPEISLWRAGKHPHLAWLLSKARPFGLCLDDVLDRLSDEASSPCHKYYACHRGPSQKFCTADIIEMSWMPEGGGLTLGCYNDGGENSTCSRRTIATRDRSRTGVTTRGRPAEETALTSQLSNYITVCRYEWLFITDNRCVAVTLTLASCPCLLSTAFR